MTIPVETLAAALAGATHRGGPRWRATGLRARHAALGLVEAGLGSGEVVTVTGTGPERTVAELAVMAAGGATTPEKQGDGSRLLDIGDLEALCDQGVAVDRARPDRFEELVASVTCDDVATIADGHRLSHGNVLWAVRSLVRWLDAGPAETVVVRADPAAVAARVAGPYLAAALAADLLHRWEGRPTVAFADAAGWDELAGRVTAQAGEGALRVARARAAGDPLTRVERARARVARRAMRALRAELGLDRCRAFVCLGPRPGVTTRRELAAAGIHVAGSWGHPGCGGIAAIGDPPCPIPGVTIGIDDDGCVAVRGPSVAAEPGGDGWLRTGEPGRLDERGALHPA